MITHDVFSKKQAIVNYKVKELLQMKADDCLKLRETNKVHVRMIRRYIFDNILTKNIYLPPIVAMIEEGSLEDGKPKKLTIIDGTQRMKALSELESVVTRTTNSDDEEEVKKGFNLHFALDDVEVAVQVFEGLSKNEADQLYIDLNTKGKKVSLSKRIAYDSRNEINQATNEVLASNHLLMEAGVEQEKNAVMRPKNKNLLSLSQLRQLVALFITGKTITSNQSLDLVQLLQTEENIDIINTWFEELFVLHPVKTIGNYEVSMLASFPLLTSIATYAIEGIEDLSFAEKKQVVVQRMRNLKQIDWTRDQPIWREFDGSKRGREKYFYLNNNKKNINAIVAWLRLKGGV